MFVLRHRMYPALGKEAEARALLTEWVQHAQGQGEQAALAQRILSSEGPTLVVHRRYDDLATLDATRRANLADDDWQARVGRLSALSREPVRAILEERLLPPSGPSTTPVGVVQRGFIAPALGKERQVRSILEEFVQDSHAAGRTQVSLWQRVFSEVGVQFTITATYADLADLAQVRQARAAITQAVVASVGELSRTPIAVRLFEVLVRFPS